MTKRLVDANNDSSALHHSFHFPDNQGTDTLVIALDEKGDTTLACRFRNWYDCVGNLLVRTLDDGQKKDTIYFRYQFTADSSTRVYGCRGSLHTACALPCSTICPWYITAIRSQR